MAEYDDYRFTNPRMNNMQMPEWLQMGDSEKPNMSPFVDALKKRMKTSAAGGMGGAMGGADMGGNMMGSLGKAAGGGMQSL